MLNRLLLRVTIWARVGEFKVQGLGLRRLEDYSLVFFFQSLRPESLNPKPYSGLTAWSRAVLTGFLGDSCKVTRVSGCGAQGLGPSDSLTGCGP